jgi:hypothetical protein
MTRDDQQCRKQGLARYLLRNMAEALGRLPLWADVEELERLRQLRLDKRQSPDPRYPVTITAPKTRQEGENR